MQQIAADPDPGPAVFVAKCQGNIVHLIFFMHLIGHLVTSFFHYKLDLRVI